MQFGDGLSLPSSLSTLHSELVELDDSVWSEIVCTLNAQVVLELDKRQLDIVHSALDTEGCVSTSQLSNDAHRFGLRANLQLVAFLIPQLSRLVMRCNSWDIRRPQQAVFGATSEAFHEAFHYIFQSMNHERDLLEVCLALVCQALERHGFAVPRSSKEVVPLFSKLVF